MRRSVTLILLFITGSTYAADPVIKEKRLSSRSEKLEFKPASSPQDKMQPRATFPAVKLPKYAKDIISGSADDSELSRLSPDEGFTALRWITSAAVVGSVGKADRMAAYASGGEIYRLDSRQGWVSSVARDAKAGPNFVVVTGDFLNQDRRRSLVFWHGNSVWTFEPAKLPLDMRGNAVVSLHTSQSASVVVAAEQGNSDSSTIIFAFDVNRGDLTPTSILKCQHESEGRNVIRYGIRAELATGPAALFVGSTGRAAWILAVKSDGDCFYSKVLNTDGIPVELKIIKESDSGYIVAGTARAPVGVKNIFVAKLDKNLNQIWGRVCGSKKGMDLMSLSVAEENVFISGDGSGIVWGSSPWLLHLSPDGEVLAEGFANGSRDETMYLAAHYDGRQLLTIGGGGRVIRSRPLGYKETPATLNYAESLASDSQFGDAELGTKRALTCLDIAAKPGTKPKAAVRDKRF
jgi:hypothetical protein